jgi:hypothetical protein
MAPTDKTASPPVGPAATTGGRVAPGAKAGCGPDGMAGSSSRLSLTPGRAVSAAGLAAETWTREVSFFGLGVTSGVPMTAVSFFASSSGVPGGAVGRNFAGGGGGPPGAEGDLPSPGGRLMRTVSFFDSSGGGAGAEGVGVSSAMKFLSGILLNHKRAIATLSTSLTRPHISLGVSRCTRGDGLVIFADCAGGPGPTLSICCVLYAFFAQQWRMSYGFTSRNVGPVSRYIVSLIRSTL